jgi:hypothetical protein
LAQTATQRFSRFDRHFAVAVLSVLSALAESEKEGLTMSFIDDAKENIAEGIEKAKEMAGDAGEFMKDKAEDVGEFAKDKAGDAADFAKDKADEVSSFVKDALDGDEDDAPAAE